MLLSNVCSICFDHDAMETMSYRLPLSYTGWFADLEGSLVQSIEIMGESSTLVLFRRQTQAHNGRRGVRGRKPFHSVADSRLASISVWDHCLNMLKITPDPTRLDVSTNAGRLGAPKVKTRTSMPTHTVSSEGSEATAQPHPRVIFAAFPRSRLEHSGRAALVLISNQFRRRGPWRAGRHTRQPPNHTLLGVVLGVLLGVCVRSPLLAEAKIAASPDAQNPDTLYDNHQRMTMTEKAQLVMNQQWIDTFNSTKVGNIGPDSARSQYVDLPMHDNEEDTSEHGGLADVIELTEVRQLSCLHPLEVLVFVVDS